MNIVHVASEFTSIIKVGGLGDVVSGLTKALAQTDHHIEVFLPKYDNIPLDISSKFKQTGSLLSSVVDGVTIHLIELSEYFNRGSVYGESDDSLRFASFSLAVSNHLQAKPTPPDIVHLHDWQTGLLAYLLRNSPKIKTILTIHNLFYQGLIPEKEISKLGLNKEALPKDHKDPKQINLLKLGILYSDIVTTVSPTYAKEILTKEMGCGLEKDLLTRPVLGILNGLDTEFWNPAKDPKIPFHY